MTNGSGTPKPPANGQPHAPQSPFDPAKPAGAGGITGMSAQDFAGTVASATASGAQTKPGAPALGQPTPGQLRPTVAHMMGEMVWLLTQSPLHKHFALADLEWMIMPALLLEQFRVFRDGARPVGLALWGYLNEEAEKKVIAGGARLRPDEWKSGDRLWLVEVIAPFHTSENKMIERMLTDLANGALKHKPFKFRMVDHNSAQARIVTIPPSVEKN